MTKDMHLIYDLQSLQSYGFLSFRPALGQGLQY